MNVEAEQPYIKKVRGLSHPLMAAQAISFSLGVELHSHTSAVPPMLSWHHSSRPYPEGFCVLIFSLCFFCVATHLGCEFRQARWVAPLTARVEVLTVIPMSLHKRGRPVDSPVSRLVASVVVDRVVHELRKVHVPHVCHDAQLRCSGCGHGQAG